MSLPACQALVDDGLIRGVLATVECQTRAYAQVGYSALTTGNGVFQTALTALLTIYVALVGYRMLFARGEVRLSDAPGIALKIGAILALVTSWSTFQTLVFNLADRAPVEIAALVSAPLQGDGASLAASPVAGLQLAYDEFTDTAIAFGKAAGPQARAYSSPEAAAAQAVSTANVALFIMSAGIISASTLAIGVLTAIGPVFIALFLIPATRGLFVGWVRALIAAALTPLVGWLLIVLMLTVLEPWLVELAQARQAAATLDPQMALSAAALVFVFAFGQAALLLGAMVMAFGFRLPSFGSERASPALQAGTASANVQFDVSLPSRAERLAMELQRDAAQSVARARSVALAAQVAPTTRVQAVSTTAEAPARLGDAYRRTAFVPRRAGAAR
jgi:type IV secretion system protein VirB6